MQTVAQKHTLVIGHKRVRRINNVSLTDQVADWLEGPDTNSDKLFAYGVCLASGIMLIGKMTALLL
ncbi:hypothetical protein V6C27_00875 [Peptococcaceae bacterium 1198_IL3148]